MNPHDLKNRLERLEEAMQDVLDIVRQQAAVPQTTSDDPHQAIQGLIKRLDTLSDAVAAVQIGANQRIDSFIAFIEGQILSITDQISRLDVEIGDVSRNARRPLTRAALIKALQAERLLDNG